MVEVTDADREAARVASGFSAQDAASLAKDFAHHRSAAYQRGKLEGARLAIEAAGERCDFLAQFPWTARRKLGAAIRALSPAKIMGEG